MRFIFKAILFFLALVFLAIAGVFFMVIGLGMLLLGKKPRVIKFSTNWQPRDFPQQPMKDVTPKQAEAIAPKVQELNF